MLSEVADGVLVHRSELLRNNTVVVRGSRGVLVVDAGITGAELVCLADDLRERGLPVVAGFATHPDWDHVLWDAALGDVPRWATTRCAREMAAFREAPDWRERAVAALPPEVADAVPLDPFGLLTPLPVGATHLPWPGPPVRVVEHPGHAPGHAALVVEQARVLVAGDMLSDLFVPMLDEDRPGADPMEGYLAGLRALEGVADEVDVVVPGHGSIGRGPEVRGRLDLDRAYVHALSDGREPDGDPRLGSGIEPGWEWIAGIHVGQAQRFAGRGATG